LRLVLVGRLERLEVRASPEYKKEAFVFIDSQRPFRLGWRNNPDTTKKKKEEGNAHKVSSISHDFVVIMYI
jgi:hypothetical protein